MVQPILLTRPIAQSKAFWDSVSKRFPERFDPVLSPLLEIRAETAQIDTTGAQALLFTSRNAVDQFAMRSDARDVPALCVGDATAALARQHGLSASSAGGDAAALAGLAAASYVPGSGHFIHFRGAHAAGSLVDALLAEGIEAEERILYDQHARALTEEAQTMLSRFSTIVPLFSPRTSAVFHDALQHLSAKPPHIVAISEAAAAPIRRVPHQSLQIASAPNAQAMLDALAAF